MVRSGERVSSSEKETPQEEILYFRVRNEFLWLQKPHQSVELI